MATLKRILWLLPLLGLVYVYASGGVGVLIGSTEHYDLLSGLGYSAEVTTWLTWLSVVIDIGGALLALFYPSALTFLVLGLWTWVPRGIGLIGGGENEIGESILVTVLAALAYFAYTRGHYLKLRKSQA